MTAASTPLRPTAPPGTPPAAPAAPPQRAPRWGRWSLRATALAYLTVLLLIPLAVILRDGLREGLTGLINAVLAKQALAALGLTLWTAAVMAIINAVMGTLTAYVQERFSF